MGIQTKKPFISGLIEGSIDAKVHQNILNTFARETISFLDFGNISITNVHPKTIDRVQFTECEISPFRNQEFPCNESQDPAFQRKASINRFSKRSIALSDIKNLLVHSFSPDDSGRRPYPSAGGLYPVEPLVFLFNERLEHESNLPSGCYHFRPISKRLQLLKALSFNHFITKLLHNFIVPDAAPCFAVLYIAHVGKSIFKYRYRGYRHALMEAGAMYQQATAASQAIGLRNTVWSTFSEQEMLYEIGLDFNTYLPLTMQFFGYEEQL